MSEEKQPVEGGDLVAEDDRIIAKAFKISVLVIVGLALVTALLFWLSGRAETELLPVASEVKAPLVVERPAEIPALPFADVTATSGLAFVHANGAAGEKLLPETMGGGVAFFDRENDGDPDLVFSNSCRWSDLPERGPDGPTPALYLNDGRGSFVDATAGARLDLTFYGMGVAAADADSDGDAELFFTALGPNRFLRDLGTGYVEEDVGVRGADDAWSTCAAFFDAERDGDLDLYVGHYVEWSREIDLSINTTLTGVGRSYGPPINFEGTQACFYVNDGSGRFEDQSERAGFHVKNAATGVAVGKALGVRPCDVDDDGDLDLMVANDTVANFLFVNDGDGTFEEQGVRAGVAYDRNGNSTGAMGIDAGWYRNDGTLGFAIGNFANEMTSLYVSQGRGLLFADEAIGEGVGAPSRKYLKFGVLFLDVDLDGRLDLFEANGHLESEIQKVQPSQSYAQPPQLFWNAGPTARATFAEVPAEMLGDLGRALVGRGAACADIDADGDLDLVVTQVGAAARLLRNDRANLHHWLRLRLASRGANTAAIGALVEVHAGGLVQRRDVIPSRSYLSQSELVLTVGLGPAERAEAVLVRWPDGARQEFGALEGDRLHVLEQAP